MARTLQQTINWATTFVNYLPLNVGTGNEPAMSNANHVQQLFFLPNLDPWPFNRGTASFQTVAGVQDYTVSIMAGSPPLPSFGYLETASYQPCATVTSVAGSGTVATITAPNVFVKGNFVTITGLSHTAFNGTFTISTATPTQFTFASAAVQAAAADSGLAVSGTIRQIDELRNTQPLAESSNQQQPNAISVKLNDNAGNITFRLMGVPDSTYNIVVNFQLVPGVFTSLGSAWGIPDHYAYVYERLFLGEALEPVDAQRAQVEKQRGILALVALQTGLKAENKAIFVSQYLNIDAQSALAMLEMQMGAQARGGQ